VNVIRAENAKVTINYKTRQLIILHYTISIMTNEQLLTPKKFAKRISYHVRTVHKWIKEGRLIAFNTNPLGGRPTWRIAESEMKKFMVLPKIVRKRHKKKLLLNVRKND